MAAVEFWARLSADATLAVPPEVAEQVPGERPVHVILLIPDSAEDKDWAQLTAEAFLQGYADSDAIYDEWPPR